MDQQIHLIQAIAGQNQQAFQELYTLYSSKVYNTAISYAQNEADAEEITQEVFVKIHKYAAQFKGDAAVGTWIYRIAVNTSLTHLKKKKRFSFLSFGQTDAHPPDFDHPGILLENKENAR